MKPPSEKQAASQIVELLADVLSCAPSEITLEQSHPASHFDFAIWRQAIVSSQSIKATHPRDRWLQQSMGSNSLN
jgi:hypothetical protein